MAHTDKTLLLETADWETVIDTAGNLQMVTGARAVAQNCANEIRLWKNDAYFQQNNGIAYQEALLAQKQDESMFKQLMREACLRVDGVASVDEVEVESFDKDARVLHGRISITTIYNETASVAF